MKSCVSPSLCCNFKIPILRRFRRFSFIGSSVLVVVVLTEGGEMGLTLFLSIKKTFTLSVFFSLSPSYCMQ